MCLFSRLSMRTILVRTRRGINSDCDLKACIASFAFSSELLNFMLPLLISSELDFWNFLKVWTFFRTREVAIITRRCFAAVDVSSALIPKTKIQFFQIFAGLLAFVLIFKSVRIIYIVLTVFSGITIGLESLTFMDTIYLLQRLPSLGIDKKYENCGEKRIIFRL